MGRPMYVCSTCGEHFTRNTSAKRHNFNIHSNAGYIVTWAEYVAGKSTNRYQATSTHSPRRRQHNSQNLATTTTTIADSVGDTFRPGMQGQPRQQPYPQQHQTPQIVTPPPQHNSNQPMSQYLALREQLLQPRPEQHTQLQLQPLLQSQPTEKKNSFGLSNETIFKLAELKARLYAHSVMFPNFDVIYQGARHFAITQGDTTFLDEKLAFFRNIDTFGGGNLNQFQSNVVL
jgi:hypothetical protein